MSRFHDFWRHCAISELQISKKHFTTFDLMKLVSTVCVYTSLCKSGYPQVATWNGWWGSWGCTTSEEAAAAAVWWKKSIPVWMTVENEFEEPSLALGHNCWLPLLGCWAWIPVSLVLVELELVPGTREIYYFLSFPVGF